MSGRKRRVPGPDGNLVDATVVGFQSQTEPWAQYLLDDGTLLRGVPFVGSTLPWV